MPKRKYIVIHCTATSPFAKPEAILRYWKEELGWNNPGYHFMIEPDGTIHHLQSLDKNANGVRGYNKDSFHIAYIGGINAQGQPLDTRTEDQRAAILACIRELIALCADDFIIQGHRDFPGVNKACPSFDAKNEYSWITA